MERSLTGSVPMRNRYVILVSWFPPKAVAGTELQALAMAEHLSKRGFEVHVITRSERILPYCELMGDIVIHRVLFLWPKPLRFTYYLCAFLETMHVRPQIIQGITLIPNGLLASLAGKLRRRPVIVHTQGSDVLLENSVLIHLFWRFILNSAQATIAKTSASLYRLRKNTVFNERIVSIANGVEISRFSLDRLQCRTFLGLKGREKLVLYVGRLVPVKNVASLLLAFSEVRKHVQGIRLLLLGTGEEKARLLELALTTDISQVTEFKGQVDPRDVSKYMIGADVFVLPSLSEGSPSVIVEALAAGTPILASNVGGVPELVRDGKEGFLFQPGNVNQMSYLLSRMLRDGRLRRRMSKAARIRARGFSMDRINDMIFELSVSVMSRFFREAD
jgi:glycosyltransferase involved in cell wall biosynthesis